MTVQINYKNIPSEKNSVNHVIFTDEKFNVTGFLKVRNVTKPVNLIISVLENYNSNSKKIRFSNSLD